MAEAIAKFGSTTFPGTQVEKSSLYVPLVAGDQARGVINIVDLDRENAFSDSDVRLLQTLANAMSVALDNARLFDETQRLLKETGQRAAEMAVINSIQQGIAAELDFQAIVDLVGDKLREVLKTEDIGIRWVDMKTGLVHFLYEYEHGQRLQIRRHRHCRGGRAKRCARRSPRLSSIQRLNSWRSGVSVVPGTDQAVFLRVCPDRERRPDDRLAAAGRPRARICLWRSGGPSADDSGVSDGRSA